MTEIISRQGIENSYIRHENPPTFQINLWKWAYQLSIFSLECNFIIKTVKEPPSLEDFTVLNILEFALIMNAYDIFFEQLLMPVSQTNSLQHIQQLNDDCVYNVLSLDRSRILFWFFALVVAQQTSSFITLDHYTLTGSCLWKCTLCFGTLLGCKAGETKTDSVSSVSKEWNIIPGVGRCSQESANSGRSCYCDDWDTPSLASMPSAHVCFEGQPLIACTMK